jgi:hypothetical protein
LDELLRLIDLPEPLLKQHATWMMVGYSIDEGATTDPTGERAACSARSTKALVDAMPMHSPTTAKMVALAYVQLNVAAETGTTERQAMRALIDASWALGYAFAESESLAPRHRAAAEKFVRWQIEQPRKRRLSIAGRKGGAVRDPKLRDLEAWVLREAALRKGSASQRANHLFWRIPADLKPKNGPSIETIKKWILASEQPKAAPIDIWEPDEST